MQDDCVFCQIVAGMVPAEIVFQDDEITAFWDQHPAAPIHILIVPNRHISSVNELEVEDAALLGKLVLKAREIATEFKPRANGTRGFF
jgi:histidine triad (HIT) family protein